MSDEVREKRHEWDPIYLYTRTDEKYEEHALRLRDMEIKLERVQNGQDKLEERVNIGVAGTGNRNSTAIVELITRLALLERENADLKSKVCDKDTGLIKQFNDLRDWVSSFNKNVTTFFILQVAGALILWAVKHFN